MTSSRLVLASSSEPRRRLLADCGIAIDVQPSGLDESILKQRLRAEGATATAVAVALAEAKARAVAVHRPDGVVIGADQILTCGDRWYDKPRDLAEARDHLRRLRGCVQTLHTACVLVGGATETWRHVAEPRLVMRPFGDAVLDAYLEAEGEAVCASVGACRIEGPGYLLFSAIEGEYAAILGLPLLALAAELRRRLILPT